MYYERLTTPHQLKAQEAAIPLAASFDAGLIGAELSAARQEPDGYERAALTAASMICRRVADTLWFPERNSDRDDFATLDVSQPPSWEDLIEKQAADCFGYSVVASECLEEAGVDHWLGYANGHATLLLPFAESGNIYLQDPLSPKLNQRLNLALRQRIPAIDDELAQHGRAAVFLNTFQIASNSNGDTQYVLDRHPWLKFNRRESFDGGRDMDSDRFEQAHRVVMSIFQPADGRRMLHDYKEFQQAVDTEDYFQAACCLRSMSRLYPEIDARKPQKHIKKILAHLVDDGKSELAHTLLDDYFGSFSVSGDSRHVEQYADCLRLLAQKERDAHLAHLAATTYERLLQSPKSFKNSIAGKLGKATMLLESLTAVGEPAINPAGD